MLVHIILYHILLSLICQGNSDFSQVELSVDELIIQCSSEHSTEVYSAIRKMQTLNFSQFNDSHKAKLSELLFKEEQFHRGGLIKIAGFLQLKETLKALEASENVQSKADQRALDLALVRVGDSTKQKQLLRNLKKIELSDRFTYELVPSLVYTRDKAVFDVLMKHIQDKRRLCLPADVESGIKIPCAYRLMSEIAPYVVDFPVEYNRFGIISDDYPATLAKVRVWIFDNKSNYELRKDIY